MIILNKSLALCTIFILLSITLLIIVAFYYICKYHYERIQLEHLKVRMRPEEVDKNAEKHNDEDFLSLDIELPFYSSVNMPQIMLEEIELPPEYWDLEQARASPLPSYDDIMYSDQVNRSFQNLLSAV